MDSEYATIPEDQDLFDKYEEIHENTLIEEQHKLFEEEVELAEKYLLEIADVMDTDNAPAAVPKVDRAAAPKVDLAASPKVDGRGQNERALVTISIEEKRSRIMEFFKNRVRMSAWNLHRCMPRKGKDMEFDSLLVQLQCERRYASSQWCIFKKSKGIYPSPTFQSDVLKLRSFYSRRISGVSHKIICNTKEAVSDFQFQPQTVPALSVKLWLHILDEDFQVELLRLQLHYFTDHLATTLAGSTTRTINDRVMQMELYYHKELRRKYIADAISALETPFDRRAATLFFGTGHMILYKEWSRALHQNAAPEIVDDLDEGQILDCIKGSEGILEYVSGWLLLRMSRVPQKKE